MEKILEKWDEFILEWKTNDDNYVGGNTGYIKPTFYDFMEWLTCNYNK